MFLLKLTGRLPTNTALLNQDGKPLYTISTTRAVLRRTTYIHRHIVDADGEPTDATEELARIHWHWASSSRLVWNGEIKDVDNLMPKTGIGSSRSFVAPDGKQYKWRMKMGGCQLYLLDGSKPEPIVAQAQRKFTDVFTRTKPTLEIEDGLLSFLDLIVITWIYVADEHQRRMATAAAAG